MRLNQRKFKIVTASVVLLTVLFVWYEYASLQEMWGEKEEGRLVEKEVVGMGDFIKPSHILLSMTELVENPSIISSAWVNALQHAPVIVCLPPSLFLKCC